MSPGSVPNCRHAFFVFELSVLLLAGFHYWSLLELSCCVSVYKLVHCFQIPCFHFQEAQLYDCYVMLICILCKSKSIVTLMFTQPLFPHNLTFFISTKSPANRFGFRVEVGSQPPVYTTTE